MGLKLYNTKTRRIEELQPIEGNKVKLYACGPTIYDYPHIGNFRLFIFVDLLKRYLQFIGYDVHHVTNLTDVDDRIIKRCNEDGISLKELTDKYKTVFFKDMESLYIMSADNFPAATNHIPDMLSLIQSLVDKNHAYCTSDGSVFFDISSFKNYGQLSKVDLERGKKTARVLNDEYMKEDARDFALWKGWKESDGDISWDSPWGKGRPGWHIECSTMSMKYLGEHFDIHCGGVDLIFPHHENEIAQSVCATGKSFVNMWVHCEHLIVDGVKMSKSLNNFYTLQDLLDRGYSSTAIRYFLLSTHYRQKLNLTAEAITSAASAVERLQDTRRRLEVIAECEPSDKYNSFLTIENQFIAAMNDDLNIASGLAVVFEWVRDLNRQIDSNKIDKQQASEALSLMKKIDAVLGIIFKNEVMLSDEDLRFIEEREEARNNRDWKRADEIRNYFLDKSIKLEDSPTGTIVKKI